MLLGGEVVAFASVARPMGQHEVVPKVERITRPRDEVVHLAGRPEWGGAVEALVLLHVPQNRAICLQSRSLRAEEKRTEVRRLSKQVEVRSANVIQPSTLDQI